jgi:ferredoxin
MLDGFSIQTCGVKIPAAPGDTVLAAMRTSGAFIQSICGGRGMCGTCRIAIAEDWLDKLPPPSPNETRLLRVLKAAAPNHRLACQTVLDEQLTGLNFYPDPPLTRILNKEIAT